MRTRHGLVVVALICAGLLGARPARADDAREAIESANASFAAAFERGDFAAVAALYTEDGALIPPEGAIVRGRPAIEAFWKGSGADTVELVTSEVESSGDLAYEVGTARLGSAEHGSTEVQYVVVWKRVNGAWRLHRDIWNGD